MTIKTKILIGVLGVLLAAGGLCILFTYSAGGMTCWCGIFCTGRPIPSHIIAPQQITITTDRTEYKQGETVEITVRNSLDKPIWYLDLDTGCHRWWRLERQVNGTWEFIQVLPPIITRYGEECISCPPPPDSVPMGELVIKLEPDSEVNDTWNLKNCEVTSGELNLKFIEPGIYRLSFSYGFGKDSSGNWVQDSWSEKTIYSKEFRIKEKFTPEPSYIFDRLKFCPDSGDCRDYGLESRKCNKIGDCVASCHYGCVNKEWWRKRGDCEAIWPNFECECINNLCQRP